MVNINSSSRFRLRSKMNTFYYDMGLNFEFDPIIVNLENHENLILSSYKINIQAMKTIL